MLRSMMQVFVKGSVEAVKLYQKAFNAELLCAYPNDHGGYKSDKRFSKGIFRIFIRDLNPRKALNFFLTSVVPYFNEFAFDHNILFYLNGERYV